MQRGRVVKATVIMANPGERSWFNPHPHYVELSWDKTSYDTYCLSLLSGLKQAVNDPGKTSKQQSELSWDLDHISTAVTFP